MHQNNLARKRRRWRKKQEKRRERLRRRLEKEELKARKKREEEEKRMALEREQSGVVCTCEARRVTVSQYRVSDQRVDHSYDVYDVSILRYQINEDKFEFTSLLEGIFCYEGNWYPAYLMANDARITVRCTTEAPPNTKISEDTFEVLFVPSKTDVSLKRQTVWLSPSLYTKFTGQVAPPPPLPAACAQHS
jgi:hypothetical protein